MATGCGPLEFNAHHKVETVCDRPCNILRKVLVRTQVDGNGAFEIFVRIDGWCLFADRADVHAKPVCETFHDRKVGYVASLDTGKSCRTDPRVLLDCSQRYSQFLAAPLQLCAELIDAYRHSHDDGPPKVCITYEMSVALLTQRFACCTLHYLFPGCNSVVA